MLSDLVKMACQILKAVPGVDGARYILPNKHYFEISKKRMPQDTKHWLTRIDLNWHKGMKNTGKDAEVYAPQWGPNGTIQCCVTRS